MYCSFCGKEIRDGARFCSFCGKNQETGIVNHRTENPPQINGKTTKSIIGILVAVAVLLVCVLWFKGQSVVGTWTSGTERMQFSSSGTFTWRHNSENYSGTYDVDSQKNLSIDCDWMGLDSRKYELEWNKNAMHDEDGDYWYISGGILYIFGEEYERQ